MRHYKKSVKKRKEKHCSNRDGVSLTSNRESGEGGRGEGGGIKEEEKEEKEQKEEEVMRWGRSKSKQLPSFFFGQRFPLSIHEFIFSNSFFIFSDEKKVLSWSNTGNHF